MEIICAVGHFPFALGRRMIEVARFAGGDDIHLAGLIIGIPQLVSFLLAVAVVAVLSFIVKNTATGRALRTIAENPDTASLLGVEVDRVVPVVFILTGLLASKTDR